MLLTIIVVVFSLMILMAFHELGHFLLAKKFDVEVEEFGIGLPPKIIGKKVGETVYSLNMIPFGAFVKMLGEEKRADQPRSFSQKPLWQRGLIIFGGVGAFWLIAFLIFSFNFAFLYVPVAVSDDFQGNFKNPRVIVSYIEPDSPAEEAGVNLGDQIVSLETASERLAGLNQAIELVNFIQRHPLEDITLTLERNQETVEASLASRVLTESQAPQIGVGSTRVADVKYPWYQAPSRGALAVYSATVNIPRQLAEIIAKKFQGQRVVGADIKGIVGIGQMMGQSLNEGVSSFLVFFSMIAIWLALFNLLPIPALDGGKLLFLALEKIKGKPVSQKVELKITYVFFALLIAVMAVITIKDIVGLF